MNGAEFFMRYAGWRLLPPDKATGDPVDDANTVLSINLPQSTGSVLRLSSCWMVITPHGVATSFKAPAFTGFDTSIDRQTAMLAALKSGEPCMLLKLGKRTMTARDLFVTYDPRAARECSQGSTKTYDATKEKSWTS
jgi:hypothetical protein